MKQKYCADIVDKATASVAVGSFAWLRARTRAGNIGLGLVSVALGAVLILGPKAQAGGGDPSSAAKISAVVELFTSQGCSSCPAADKLLKTYVERSDVVALSFPIDYWDYLGWPDTFASPMNTARQREYARARHDGAVYTPQAVVNGAKHFVGFNKNAIDASIGKDLEHNGGATQVPLRFFKQGSQFVVETGPASREIPTEQMMFWIVAVQSSGVVKIKRGENKGRDLTYYNIVRGLTPVGSWDGKPKTIRVAMNSVEKPHADSYLVLLQKGASGPICGAAWLTQ